jgi:hypothetical protein
VRSVNLCSWRLWSRMKARVELTGW